MIKVTTSKLTGNLRYNVMIRTRGYDKFISAHATMAEAKEAEAEYRKKRNSSKWSKY